MKDPKQIKSIIAEQNPWWKGQSVPDYLDPPIERPLARHLWKYILSSDLKRHLIILGPRRVGKTTVMYQTVRHLLKEKVPPDKIQWVRLDHPLFMPLDLGSIVKDAISLAKATRKQPLYLFLDELVYSEKWDLWLKTFYDEHWPVRIEGSSSATAALQKGRESGVGRWEEFYLAPYLLTELLQLYNKNIKFPIYKKKQCLHNTINSLSKSLPHTQLNFEEERKLMISLGGFPEFLAGKKREEDEVLESIKKGIKKGLEKELSKIVEMEKQVQNLHKEAVQMSLKAELSKIKEVEEKISEKKKDTIFKFKKKYAEQIMDGQLDRDYFHKSQQILKSDAIERAIYKDIPQSYRIDSPLTLERLLYVLAGQVTGLLSPKGISQDISQVSPLTLERYLNYLTQTYLVFTLSNYDNNERNVQRRQRKIYFVDVAIRNAALQKDQIFNDPAELGKLRENLVASHLYHLGKQSSIRLYHWRRGKYEVDFVYDDPVHPMAFEVGTSKTHSRSGLKKFLQENPKFQKGCYYIAPDLQFLSAEESTSGIGELPLDLLLLATGLQQDEALSVLLGSKKTGKVYS
ncbi:MAG: AAA family ATPase [Bdellovibrionales bacterium]|nr:AAA family ATPase [Bdellovibrionales bacterium]